MKIGQSTPIKTTISIIDDKPIAFYSVFKNAIRASRTYSTTDDKGLTTCVDFDENGEVIGIEVVGLDSKYIFEKASINSFRRRKHEG